MHHHRVSVSKAFFSAVLCLAMITASIIVFSSCTVREEPQAVYTPEQTETGDDKEKQVEPAGSTEIVNKAIELAWPYGTPKEVYKYEGGSPTEEFKSALDAAYPDRSGWGKKPKAGASCDAGSGRIKFKYSVIIAEERLKIANCSVCTNGQLYFYRLSGMYFFRIGSNCNCCTGSFRNCLRNYCQQQQKHHQHFSASTNRKLTFPKSQAVSDVQNA
jgi:hypothetical protein